MSRPLTKKRQAYRTAVANQLATLYAPIGPDYAPSAPNPADTIGRLTNIKRMLELGEINRSTELIDELIDALKI